MLLEKLEIKGFKSFGDKIQINFDKGITGIVGPNGCGKSNVVDAIRWVLGEQRTRALRSEKMENIIFNGTKKRKALQLAEVSLTFSNTKNLLPTEYSQLTITRRYFRSGDSEYELNGVPCRLKDITNLFMDTGITSNSYAIIELGMVDDLLNDRENSRRGLFEEAAGISKFKKRKKETLKKLSDTDADLERVEDLVFEIEKNLKSLKKQAKQAEKYYELKEQYKILSIQLASLYLEKYQSSLKTISDQIKTESDRKIELNKSISEIEAANEDNKKEQIQKEKTLSSRQKALNEYVNKIRQYESDKKIKNERLRFLNDKSDNLKEQLDLDKKSHDRAEFSIQSLGQEKEAAQNVLNEVSSKREKLQEEKESQNSRTQLLKDEVDSITEILRNKREEVYHIKKSLEINSIQISTLKQELDKTSSDTSERSESLIEFENKINELRTTLNSKNQELDKLKSDEKSMKERITTTEKTVEVIKEEFTQIGRKLDSKQNEYNLTKSLVDNLEGFPEAIKFLKKESGWGKNVPLLSDVITCSEEYRVIIENYLEPYMNYYIVDSADDAYKAVNLLSDASRGRAHFFILDKFDDYHPTATNIYNNAFPATEIVEYDDKYLKLVSYILDNVYIVEGDSQNIPESKNAVFITKNGKVTQRAFSISGGSVGLFEGKRIGRAKNLEKLSKEIKQLQTKLQKIESSLKEKQDELNEFREKLNSEALENLQLEVNRINEEYVSVSTKQEQYVQLLSKADIQKEDLLSQINTLEKDLSRLDPESVEKEKELLTLESKLNEVKIEYDEQNRFLEQKSSEFNNENILFHQKESRVSSIDQEIEFKRNNLLTTRERIVKNQEDLQKTNEEIKTLVEASSTQDTDLVAMYDEKEQMEIGVNEAEKDYYQVRGIIDEKEKDVREIQRKREQIDSLLMELHTQLNEVKLELNSVKDRLSVEFNVNLEDISKDSGASVQLDEEELKNKVERIKTRLENMGPINPMAMEAYEEIKERHTFILTQKDDLLKAKESLLTTIEEIDMVAKTTFLDAFDKIKENFVKVFRSLFTEEDDCDLLLTDPDNPLESAIEIKAKPKGKKPISINQLSGGEKTLTATSLLFAIYLIKPAPFCIFDEVDAPLDDANIDKFNQIIQKFSEESQFIIVTHNKRTMSSTDVIYGITMIEQGVSKVVPVDLRELA